MPLAGGGAAVVEWVQGGVLWLSGRQSKNIEKIQPEGFEECGLPKAAYYVIHCEDGTTEEADFIAEHDEEGDDDYVPQTEEEILEDFREAVRELKLSLEGKIKLMPLKEALANWDNIDVDG